MNQPQGRSYLKTSSAVFGDDSFGVDLTTDARFVAEVEMDQVSDGQTFNLATVVPFADTWFQGGILEGLTGEAKGLRALIKHDQLQGVRRQILLWQPLRVPVALGDQFRLIAGYDSRAETHKAMFGNLETFRGFPHIPGDDWLMAVPRASGTNNGGRLS